MENKKITVPPVIKDNLRKPPFPDDIRQLKGIDPSFDTQTDFDWPRLEELLGEIEQLQDSGRALLADVLRRIFEWAIRAPRQSIRLDMVGRRMVALAWVINPGFFGGISLTELSRRTGLKYNKLLATETGNASRKFNLRSHAQSHAANFKQQYKLHFLWNSGWCCSVRQLVTFEIMANPQVNHVQ
jgi:hypothetical protein